MSSLLRVPQLGVNDEQVKIVKWLKEQGSFVRRGEAVCAVETTKALVEIEAESEGYLVQLAKEEQSVGVGELFAALTGKANEDITPLLAEAAPSPAGAETEKKRWTKKAALLARRSGVDLEQLAALSPGKIISEADVLAARGHEQTVTSGSKSQVSGVRIDDTVDREYQTGRAERVLIIGGAGKGGVLVLDALGRTPTQRAVGIVDNNSTAQGKTFMGVPVLGTTDKAEEVYRSGICDAVVIAFAEDIDDRAQVFEDLSSRGVRFTNVIDPTVSLRLNSSIGRGNVILANCYIAPCTAIGDNNFLSSHTCLEHHNVLGNHCTFGPSVSTSGRVTIGNKVKFGTNIAIEPFVRIGDNSIIASGCILTGNIQANSIVKLRPNHTVRARENSPGLSAGETQ